ncbi:MAG: hypothetical protein AB1650_01630 [Candidatus Omnitrophota bacterium]
MKLKLSENWTKKLLSYPETGMGYQRVDIVLKSGQVIKNIIVLNAEELVLPEEYAELRVEDVSDLIVQKK